MRLRAVLPFAGALLVCLSSGAGGRTAQPSPERLLGEVMQVSDFTGLSVSPDGRSLVFRVERADQASDLYPSSWYAWSEGKVHAIGSGGDAIYVDPGVSEREVPIWSDDSRSIFFRALTGDQVQIWRARVDGDVAERVVSDDADVLSISPDPKGGGLVFTTGPSRDAIRRAEEAEYQSGILVDGHVDLAQNLFRGAIINNRHATQRLTGFWFSRGGLLWRANPRSYVLDFRTLEVRPASPAASLSASSGAAARAGELVALSPTGSVARALPDGGGFAIRAGSGVSASCGQTACRERIAWMGWTPDGQRLAFATKGDDWAQTLFLWDARSGGARRIGASDGLLNGGRESEWPCAAANDALFCVEATAESPPRLVRIALHGGQRTILFDPNAGLRELLGSLRIEHLRWRGAQGHDFSGVLLSARAGTGRRPLFVNYYLCEGFLRGGLGDEWPLAALAAAGIDSACVTSAVIPGEQDALANDRAAAEGVAALVDRLAAEGRVDRSRVGMGGLSFGSEVTLWLAFNTRLLAAASISSPGLEPTYYWLNGAPGRDNHEKLRQVWKLGAPDETPDGWKQLSAALNTERITAPLLMQMPEQEIRLVPELYARLASSPTPVELYAFPDEPHVKVQPRHKLAAYRRNLDWFRYWLEGERDADPMKDAQYARWDALRARRDGVSAGSTTAATAPSSPGRTRERSGDRPFPGPAANSPRPPRDR
jgi:dipeptidyl aminopeptidase/acylaminoacyl peptidase